MADIPDYTPGPWAEAHDFSAARAVFDANAGRGFRDAVAASVTYDDLVAPFIETKTPFTLEIWADETGSMGKWPGKMFEKLPFLWVEATSEYLGPDAEIFFGAVGDANSDHYPLQAHGFAQGTEALAKRLLELKIEGNGGGTYSESYELAALYSARNIRTPNARHRIVIFIGDEKPYPVVSPDQAKQYAKVDLARRLTTMDVFAELRRQASVYLVHKPYGNSTSVGNTMDDISRDVRHAWIPLVGEDHIVELPGPDRIVDVIFGILAHETGRVDYFMKELEGRQKRDQVETVYRSLKTVMAVGPGTPATRDHSGKSVMFLKEGGDVAKPLI